MSSCACILKGEPRPRTARIPEARTRSYLPAAVRSLQAVQPEAKENGMNLATAALDDAERQMPDAHAEPVAAPGNALRAPRHSRRPTLKASSHRAGRARTEPAIEPDGPELQAGTFGAAIRGMIVSRWRCRPAAGVLDDGNAPPDTWCSAVRGRRLRPARGNTWSARRCGTQRKPGRAALGAGRHTAAACRRMTLTSTSAADTPVPAALLRSRLIAAGVSPNAANGRRLGRTDRRASPPFAWRRYRRSAALRG